MELKSLSSEVCKLIRSTGEFLRTEVDKLHRSDVQLKGFNNFVTYVDKQSEEILISGLTKLLPGTGFIAEEDTSLAVGTTNWIIDPLDGTTNFIHGIPVFSISIGLMDRNEMILGNVLEVNSGECFYTWKGAPSYMNGKEIHVSETRSIDDCLFATGFPYYDFRNLDAYISLFRYFMQRSHGVRRLGSAAADLSWVACGRFDGFYEYGLSPWDVAAGALLVKNAGGRNCDFSFGENYIFGKEIISTNNDIFEAFKKIFREQFI
jgi:myo-inositol-1(or 4)-monophosphatase